MTEPSTSTAPTKPNLRNTRDKRQSTPAGSKGKNKVASDSGAASESTKPDPPQDHDAVNNDRILQLEILVQEQAAATRAIQTASQATNQLLEQLLAGQQASSRTPSQHSARSGRPETQLRRTVEKPVQTLDDQDEDPSDSSHSSLSDDSGVEEQSIPNRRTNFRARGGRHHVQTLSDGETKGPTIDAYILQVKGEFTRNAHDYSNLQLRLLFLVETTENPAQRILMARMKEGSTQQFKSVKEAFKALRVGLGKVHDPAEAEETYRRLEMSEDGLYSEFITEFLLKSADANIEPSDLRRDLWVKVSDKLQLKMGPTKHLYKTFTKLSNALQSADNEDRWTRERMINTRPPRRPENKKSIPTPDGPSSTPFRTPGGRYLPTSTRHTSVPQLPVRQRTQTPGPDTSQCFNCDGYGHYARDCSKPKRSTAEIKEIYGADWEPENEENYSENE